MAQNGLARIVLCRGCRNEALRPLLLRPFSSTSQRCKSIPVFSPSSSSELDDLFANFRTKIFTPGALSKVHRDLIYKPTRAKLLTSDPGVTVTMSNEEEIKLVPMKLAERPNKKKALIRLLQLMQDGKDWQNLPAFLEGIKTSNEKLPKGFLERLMRKANEQGKAGIMIRCAEMVKKTGVSLANAAVTNELMLGIHILAARAGFKGEEMEKALHRAQEVTLLLQKPEHCGGRTVWKKGERDMRKDIAVLGINLELAAATPPEMREATEPASEGLVAKTASKILALWPQEDLTAKLDSHQTRQRLERWLPLWVGMKFALQGHHGNDNNNNKSLLDEPLYKDLQEAYQALTKSVQEAMEFVKETSNGRPRRCMNMFEDLKDL